MKAAIVPKIGVCHWMMLIRPASAKRRQGLYAVLRGTCPSSARLGESLRVGLLDAAPDVPGPAPGCPSVRFRQPTPGGAIIWPPCSTTIPPDLACWPCAGPGDVLQPGQWLVEGALHPGDRLVQASNAAFRLPCRVLMAGAASRQIQWRACVTCCDKLPECTKYKPGECGGRLVKPGLPCATKVP